MPGWLAENCALSKPGLSDPVIGTCSVLHFRWQKGMHKVERNTAEPSGENLHLEVVVVQNICAVRPDVVTARLDGAE